MRPTKSLPHLTAGLLVLVSQPVCETGLAGPYRAEAPQTYVQQVQIDAGFSVSNTVAKPGDPIPLKISIGPNLNPDFSFIMLRGLPPDFQVSAGFKTKDAWAVSLPDLRGLRLLPPPGYQGMLQVEVVLVRGKDQPMEKRNSIVLVRADDLADTAAPPKPSPVPQQQSAAANVTVGKPAFAPETVAALPDTAAPKQEPQALDLTPEETALLLRGDRLLETGDVAAARLLYTRVARKGFAEGALKMARTYDPQFLNTIPTAGLRPDIQQARQWYQRASELGSSDASKRLTTLAGSE